MKKKTKELLMKIAVGFTPVAGSAFFLFGKKNDAVLNNYDIGDDWKDKLVGKTDELLSVIILGIGGESFDEKIRE